MSIRSIQYKALLYSGWDLHYKLIFMYITRAYYYAYWLDPLRRTACLCVPYCTNYTFSILNSYCLLTAIAIYMTQVANLSPVTSSSTGSRFESMTESAIWGTLARTCTHNENKFHWAGRSLWLKALNQYYWISEHILVFYSISGSKLGVILSKIFQSETLCEPEWFCFWIASLFDISRPVCNCCRWITARWLYHWDVPKYNTGVRLCEHYYDCVLLCSSLDCSCK